MNRHDVVDPLSLHAVLVDPGNDVHREIVRALGKLAARERQLGALVAAPHVRPEVVFSAVAQAIAATLTRSAPALAVGGLVTVRDLVNAGRATSRDPDLTVVVPLASYRLSHRETQTLQITARPLTTSLSCALEVVFDLEPVNATVARGRLVHLGDAQCHVSSSLSLANREVLVGGPRTITLAAHLRLGPGLPLVPVAHSVPA
jgi:hypothetical protein